jgi:argininosuccinate synthase
MKIVLAYSGGLDTSVILKWLKEKYNADIIAFCADIGQEEELEGLEEKALATGASRCILSDLRQEFASDFIFPLLQAGALYENQYYLGTAIARPLRRRTGAGGGRRTVRSQDGSVGGAAARAASRSRQARRRHRRQPQGAGLWRVILAALNMESPAAL